MESFLPIVKSEICYPLQKDLDVSPAEYLKINLKKLEKENPIVALWIKMFAKTTRDKKGSALCALLVYKMLESQIEANYMNEELI